MNGGSAASEAPKVSKVDIEEAPEWQKVAIAAADKLGPVQLSPQGGIAFEFFKDIMMIIARHARSSFSSTKKELVEQRRALLKDFKIKEYGDIVKQLVKKEEEAIQSLT